MSYSLVISVFTLFLSLHTFAQSQYRQLEAIVAQNEQSRNACAGVQLVVSCGNKICEPHKEETQQTCPADCTPNVTVRSYNSITLCDDYTSTHIPQNVHEVADIVRMAVSLNKTVKAIGASHSATDLMCANGVLIPMRQLSQVYGVSKLHGVDVVEAEAGITVFELSEWLHEKGLALAGLPHMGFRDVTIGGAIATGSHGSTPNQTGVISNIVEAVEFVDGKGQVHYLDRMTANQNTFKALSAHLGLLGIVTKLKLRIQKQFNLAVNITYHPEKRIDEKGIIGMIADCDYGQLNWFPGHGTFMRTCGRRSNKKAHRGATNELLSPKIPSWIVNTFKKALQVGACNNDVMCLIEDIRWLQFKLQPPVLKKNIFGKIVNKRFVVGPAHRMVSSHLTQKQDGFFQMDWEIAVPASKAQAAFNAIREHVQSYGTCLPLVGVFIRYAPSEGKSLMAHTYSDGKDWIEGEPAVFFEMPVYVPVGFTKEQFDQYEKPFVEFATMLIEKYSGRPHWGKNRQWAFDLAIEKGAYAGRIEAFQAVVDQYDPNGTFANDFGRKLGLRWE